MAQSLTDRISGAVFRSIMKLPERALKVLAGRPIIIDGHPLTPETQVALKLMALQPEPPVDERVPAKERLATTVKAAMVAGPTLPLAVVENRTIAGAAGPLKARLYVPHGAPDPSPLMVYFHGGGWVVGDLDSHDSVCRFLAHEGTFRVLSVDYRLAPEHKHPAAVDDATAAFRAVVKEAKALGADPKRIAVGGDSAGGHLSAAVCLDAKADGGPMPAYQLLIYPVTDMSRKARSYALFPEGFFLTSAEMDWYIGHYLAASEDASDPRASVLLAENLSGLPPAFVATAGYDVLRDEGEAFAKRLEEAGVDVTLRRYEGYIHGFANTANLARGSRRAMTEMAQAVAKALA